jgi:hypothetical protein
MAARLLITVDYRGGDDSPLRGLRGVGATVFGPVERAAAAVVRPVGKTFDALKDAPGQRSYAARMQKESQPASPLLYSLRGFQYCDLLLSDAERAAWQRWRGAKTSPSEVLRRTTTACDAVSERAAYALRLAEANRWLLDIGLDYLTLARAALYKGQPARDHIDAAVDGLRASGITSHLPRGLLTRAWQRCLSGDEPGSRADLDEA